MLIKNVNEIDHQAWLKQILTAFPQGERILNAGARELKKTVNTEPIWTIACKTSLSTNGGGATDEGFQSNGLNTMHIELVSDITAISVPDVSFDAILCSELLEHVPKPTHALVEFAPLVQTWRGVMILIAQFSSKVHLAPNHYCSSFIKYWYEYYLTQRGLRIKTLAANGYGHTLLLLQIKRLVGLKRQRGNWAWPFANTYALLGLFNFKIRSNKRADDLACFSWHCMAVKTP
jgi:hypothetical protein